MTTLIENGKLLKDLGFPSMNPKHKRVMLYENSGMRNDPEQMLELMGFVEGNTILPGDFLIERASVDK